MVRREEGSIERVMRALQDMGDTIDHAQLRLGNQCVVSRPFLLQQMECIGKYLPDAVSQGAALVQQEQEILEQARREASEQVKKARADAQKLLDEAKKQAEELKTAARRDSDEAARARQEAKNHAEAEKARADREAAAARQQAQRDLDAARQQVQRDLDAARQQAQQVYMEIVSKAQFDAGNLTQQAEAAARAAVSQDNVHRMAVVAAQEMQDAAAQEAAMLRERTMEFADRILRNADTYLCKLIEDIRRQRQALDECR